MTDVFVSYKRDDLSLVLPLVTALRANRLAVWWDQDIPPDAPWEATIEQELANAQTVIVAWSPASVASENVKAEARRARHGEKLVQVFVEPCDPPIFFGERQGVNLASWDGRPEDQRFKLVEAAVRAILSGERPPSILSSDTGKVRANRNPLKYAEAHDSLRRALERAHVSAQEAVAILQPFDGFRQSVALEPLEERGRLMRARESIHEMRVAMNDAATSLTVLSSSDGKLAAQISRPLKQAHQVAKRAATCLEAGLFRRKPRPSEARTTAMRSVDYIIQASRFAAVTEFA